MEEVLKRPSRDHRQLQQLIAGVPVGIMLVDLDQTILWANEAALAMHGVDDVAGLGETVDAYRSRFKLTYRNNKPLDSEDIPIDRLMKGEVAWKVTVEIVPANDPEDRRVHAIRCLIVTDPSDRPDYLVFVIEDESDRFEAEERFESAFNANPAPALICRVADLTFVRVNRGFLEMTGYAKDDIVGRTADDFDVLYGRDDCEGASERLRAGETIRQAEGELTLPDRTRKCVIVAGQPIEIADERCILFTFADLEPRRRAETALRQSEERFAKAFDLSPVALSILRRDDCAFIEANGAFETLSGRARETVLGRNAADLGLWEEPGVVAAIEASLAEGASIRDRDVTLVAADGGHLDCLLAVEPITIGETPCALCVLQDITERKRTETELISAIEAVMSDTSWFARRIVEKLASLRQTAPTAQGGVDLDALSPRERDVLGLICQGYGDKEIAKSLTLSPNTVRNHVGSLYRKLGVKRRSAAIVWARERGITGPDTARTSVHS